MRKMPTEICLSGNGKPATQHKSSVAKLRKLVPHLLLLLANFASTNVFAQIRVEKDDISLLPQECMMRYRPESEVGRHWASILKNNGGDIGITHYCVGMKGVFDIYRGVPKPDRAHWIKATLNEFSYVEDRWPENHILRPSIEIAKGRVRYYEQKYDQATAHFKRAIQLNENLVDGYAWLSDSLMESGKKEEAHEVIKAAAEKFPGNRKIELRIKEYNKGKK